MLCQFQMYNKVIQLFIYKYIYSFFTFSSIIDCYKILSIVPSAIQQVLVGYLFYFFSLFSFYLFIFLYNRFLLSILYILMYICQSQSPNSSHHNHCPPPQLSPFCVHTFVLYICVSISALQTCSSVPFFQIPHICINIRNLFFSF